MSEENKKPLINIAASLTGVFKCCNKSFVDTNNNKNLSNTKDTDGNIIKSNSNISLDIPLETENKNDKIDNS
jgi:hypothetical protein